MKVEEAIALYHSNHLDDQNILRIIASLSKGISFPRFTALTKSLPFSLKEWASFLHLTERSLQRYKKDKKTFAPIHAEKIATIKILFQKGSAVFGTEDAFYTWLNTKSIALGGQQPMAFLKSSFGIQLILDELGRIEHGVLA